MLKDYIRLDVDITKRLISFASRNANEAAFLLLGIGGFVFIKFYNKINFLNSISLIIFLSALFLTWTRSGWILFILLIISFFIILGKVKTKFFYNSFFLSFFVICFIAIMIINRNENESRMLSDETIMLRFELYFQYFNSLKLLPIFFGVFETIWVTCDRLFIEKYISSENIFLDTFVKYGLLGGCLFMACCFVFTYNYLYILGLAKKINQKLEPEDYHFVVILFCTFFFTLIMANTSLFEQTSFFWILFALSIPLRQVLVKSNHSYEHEI